MKRTQHLPNRNPGDIPPELYAPLSWRPAELATLAARVRGLVAAGHPRSVASQVAFGELTTNRAIERARAEATVPIGTDGLPQPPEAETSYPIGHDLPQPPESAA